MLISKAPPAPMPPASVGVNNPPYKPPITNKNSRMGAQTSRRAVNRSAHELAGAVGSHPGRTRPITAIVVMYIVTARKPGNIPATNSLPMSCWVISPYTARTIDGGNIAPSVPPAAITPVAKDCG